MSGVAQTMQCMEVWGGNQAADSAITMAGLDAWIYCRPYQSVRGGDVYYVSSCATGRISRLLLADVSGHGGGVSSAAEDLRRLMRAYINYLDQSAFVEEMNRKFAAVSQSAQFATAVVVTFYAPTGGLALSLAGHPPPLLYRAKERQWQFIPQSQPAGSYQPDRDMPLGVQDATAYSQLELELGAEDLVLCYTDPFIDARGAGGGLLGTEGLLAIARTLSPGDPGGVVRELVEKVAREDPANLKEDDVTALAFRPKGRRGGIGWRRRLFAPVAFVRSAVRSWRNGDPIGWPQMKMGTIGRPFPSKPGRR